MHNLENITCLCMDLDFIFKCSPGFYLRVFYMYIIPLGVKIKFPVPADSKTKRL